MVSEYKSLTAKLYHLHGIFQKHVDPLRFAFVNTDINTKNNNLGNAVDTGTQNERQNSLPKPNSKYESKLQNEPPISSNHSYIQPSIASEISNPSEPQTLQPS